MKVLMDRSTFFSFFLTLCCRPWKYLRPQEPRADQCEQTPRHVLTFFEEDR